MVLDDRRGRLVQGVLAAPCELRLQPGDAEPGLDPVARALGAPRQRALRVASLFLSSFVMRGMSKMVPSDWTIGWTPPRSIPIAEPRLTGTSATPRKRSASEMITDHTKTSDELKSMVPADAKGAIPASLDSSSQSKVDKLKDAKRDDFSSDFDSMQVSAHKDAVSLFERRR